MITRKVDTLSKNRRYKNKLVTQDIHSLIQSCVNFVNYKARFKFIFELIKKKCGSSNNKDLIQNATTYIFKLKNWI